MCICGALPEEQDRRQPYEFDIDVHADVTAATHDDVKTTLSKTPSNCGANIVSGANNQTDWF